MAYFAITVAHDEGFFLPRWVAYYGAQLGLANLFVVDHGSTDGSTSSLPSEVNLLRVPRDIHDDDQRARFVSQLHAGLLQYFEGGFVVDTDEFLVADPRRWSSLAAFAAAVPHAAVSGMGVNIMHMRDIEPDFDPALGLLAQRHYGVPLQALSKPAFARVPTKWGGGFHVSSNQPQFVSGFQLLHMKNFDFTHRLARQAISRNWPWSGKQGVHARKPDDDVLADFAACEARRRRGPSDDFDFVEEAAFLTSLIKERPVFYVFAEPAARPVWPVRRVPEAYRDLF